MAYFINTHEYLMFEYFEIEKGRGLVGVQTKISVFNQHS